MKKLLSVVLSVCMMLSILLIGPADLSASAAEAGIYKGYLLYSINDGEVTITGFTASCGAVTVPTHISNCPVTTIAPYALAGSGVTALDIPYTVNKIGDYAFANCSQLQRVVIHTPSTGMEYGVGVFYDCPSLGTPYITGLYTMDRDCLILRGDPYEGSGPDTIVSAKTTGTTLKPHYDYYLMTYFDDTVTEIGPYAFSKNAMGGDAGTDCERYNFGGIIITDRVTTIGEGAFKYAYTNTWQMGEAIETIGDYAFYGSNIPEAILPETLKSIGDYAFGQCKSLKTVVIPDSVTHIGVNAFVSTPADTVFKIYSSNTYAINYAKNHYLNYEIISQPALKNLTVKNDGFRKVSFFWSKVSGAAGYIIQFKKQGEDRWYSVGESVGTSYKSDYLFDYNTKVTFKVTPYKMVDGMKCSGVPQTKSITINIGSVSNLKATPVNTTSIKLTWDNMLTATGYKVYYKSSTAKSYTYLTYIYENSYTKKGLSANKEYDFKVVPLVEDYYTGTNGLGIEKTVSSKTLKNLSAPKTVTATLIGPTDVKVSWSKVSGADAYRVYYRNANKSTYELLKTTAATSYEKEGLTDGAKYYFKIVPCTKVNGSYYAASSYKTASVTTAKDVSAPSKVTAKLYGYDDVKVTWSKVSGATAYRVYYRKSTEKSYKYKGTTKTTSMNLANLADGTKYLVMVRPCVTANGKYYTDDSYKTTSISTTKNLSAPKTVKAKLYGYDDVKVSWSKVSGANAYRVYYKSGSGKYKLKTTTTKLSYSFSNLSDGKKYTFKIVPCTKVNGGYYADTSYKTVTAITLKKVATPKVSKKNNGKVTVSWSNIAGESGYQISKSTSKTKTGTITTYTTTTGKSKDISATKGKTYYYKVRAFKTVDGKKIYGAWSDVKSYKIK